MNAPFVVRHRRTSAARLEKDFGADVAVFDLTSKGPEPWVRFSPFFPHGGIPVPGRPGTVSQSVEGIWQGLKVFEAHGVDLSRMEVTNMRGLKRTVRRFGPVRGHLFGAEPGELLLYGQARHQIYLPAYRWVLENALQGEVAQLRQVWQGGRAVVLLDYETNVDVDDLSRPLSHAGLVVRYCTGKW